MPLSYKELERILRDFGYHIIPWGKGSHTKWQWSKGWVLVPQRGEFRPGTGKSIISALAGYSGVSMKDIVGKYHIKR